MFLDVTEVVKDAGGLPLPGAAVRVKATQNVVVMDRKWKTRIKNAINEAILVFTSIGYKNTRNENSQHTANNL